MKTFIVEYKNIGSAAKVSFTKEVKANSKKMAESRFEHSNPWAIVLAVKEG